MKARGAAASERARSRLTEDGGSRSTRGLHAAARPRETADGEQDYLSPRQVAERVGVGIDKVKEWMVEGLRYSDLGYRTKKIKIDWLEAFIEERSRASETKKSHEAPTEERSD